VIRKIVELQLNRIKKRFADTYRAEMTWEEDLVEAIASRCREVESGARNIEHILSRGLLPRLSALLLGRMADGVPIGTVRLSLNEAGDFEFALN